MDQQTPDFKTAALSSLREVTPSEWDRVANGSAENDSNAERNPFIRHAFLSSLEDSGSATARSGWKASHVTVRDQDERLVGAAPAYVKSNSYGEYVFDHAWADAFHRAGGRYYPKLQVSVPFTPVTGPRLLADSRVVGARAALITGLAETARAESCSSIHVTFATPEDHLALTQSGFLARIDRQYHWINRGYASFDGFLEDLASRKRKQIRRERRDALANGITIRRLTGSDIKEADWDAFHAFYMDTGGRKWGTPYLTRAFFSLIGERMGEDVLLIIADRAGKPIAGALNLIGSHALYGRNWGAIEHHPFLHFEVCYYQAIEFAIERGLKRVEAGAQGEHKLARGYLPAETRSAHLIAHPGLAAAVADYLERERRAVEDMMEELSDMSPFRRDLQEG